MTSLEASGPHFVNLLGARYQLVDRQTPVLIIALKCLWDIVMILDCKHMGIYREKNINRLKMFCVSVISNISTCVWIRTVFIKILQPESTFLVADLVGNCYVLVTSVHEDRWSSDSGTDSDAKLSAVSKE